jgi:hypothetical protein
MRTGELVFSRPYASWHFDPTKSLVPGALVVWEAVVVTMRATRSLANTVTAATVLGCGDHRIVSMNGNRRG